MTNSNQAPANQPSANPRELAKSFDPKTIESHWYDFWESRGYYAAGLNPEIKAKISVFYCRHQM